LNDGMYWLSLFSGLIQNGWVQPNLFFNKTEASEWESVGDDNWETEVFKKKQISWFNEDEILVGDKVVDLWKNTPVNNCR